MNHDCLLFEPLRGGAYASAFLQDGARGATSSHSAALQQIRVYTAGRRGPGDRRGAVGEARPGAHRLSHNACLGILALALTCPLGAHALSGQTLARQTLQAAKRLSCEFSAYATVVWTGDETIAQMQPRFLSVRFDAIDTQGGTALAGGMLRHAPA